MTNCKPRIAIIYASATGHTERLAEMVKQALEKEGHTPDCFRAEDARLQELSRYDVLLVGTYTWANGEIPEQLHELYEALERLESKPVTGVFGTGDRFFATYCGAVNQFRDMLYAKTALAATLKVEQMPALEDEARCRTFAESLLKKYNRQAAFEKSNS